jgi:hypothetical protein
MKNHKISSLNIVGCKIKWELELNCYKDLIRVVLAGYGKTVLDGMERNVPAFWVGVGYCSLGAAICTIKNCLQHP